MALRRTAPRGAAITELALVVPLFITLLVFGMFFTELVRAKLKMLEAARLVAWELTSYTLDDYGADRAPRHDAAFALAKAQAGTMADRTLSDLDSVDDRPSGNLLAGFSAFRLSLQNDPVALPRATFDLTAPATFGGPYAADVLSALDGSAAGAHRRFGFNTRGMVTADLEIRLDNRILPRHFLDDSRGFFSVDQWGGSNLQSIRLRSRMTLIASSWALSDGADAVMQIDESRNGEQAGLHRGNSIHGMWLQVNRMTHLAKPLNLTVLPSVAPWFDPLSFVLPQPMSSTYVTSHNYGLDVGFTRGCDGDRSHPARDGLNNLEEDSVIDWKYRKCYETTPFRDQAGYDGDDGSLQVKVFEARGAYFMGCQNAQAEDPTDEGRSALWAGDVNNRKIECRGDVR